MTEKRLQVKTLGGWSVTYDGKAALRGKNLKIVLHALVLGGGKVFREDLAALIGENETHTPTGRYVGVKNSLTRLRRQYSLQIPEDEDPVILSTTQPDASIDLWEFFAHVRAGQFAEAYAFIAEGQEPYLLAGVDDPEHPVWEGTLAKFREAREETIAALEVTAGKQRSMLATRERLLGRSLVPGVGPPVSIGSLRDKLEDLQVPWAQERPEATKRNSSLPQYLAELLRREGPAPTQAIVVGPPGAGKTLTAISAFLRLTDPLAGKDRRAEVRTVLYLDPEAEGSQPGFGTAKWLERHLRQEKAEGKGRPILIMPHADALLSPRSNLKPLLNSRLFRDHDLLLCCGGQLYSRRLSYEDFGTHVIHLNPWSLGLQKAFARRVAGKGRGAAFEAWLKKEPTRGQLCSVPLHLVHVLSLLGEDTEALAEISTPPQLFEGVARMRLRVAGTGFDEDELIRDLGALAHRFHADAAPADTPITFTAEELKLFLKSRGRRDVGRRAEAMINNTLLTLSRPGGSSLRFEEPSWGWYFVARHIVHTLLHRPEDTSAVFSKLLSARMTDLCEEMLQEKARLYEEEIYESLGAVLRRRRVRGLEPERLAVARAQIGYLLAVIGDERIRKELAPLVSPGSSSREPHSLVRRGIVLGLADGGAPAFADRYVEMLTAERRKGGRSLERDTNIGFLLSSRGDQRLDLAHPERISKGANPIRTVGDIVESLYDLEHAGSWRIKLFTLIDLSRHPLISKTRFREAVDKHRDRLQDAVERLRKDPRTHDWPELEEVDRVLQEDTAA